MLIYSQFFWGHPFKEFNILGLVGEDPGDRLENQVAYLCLQTNYIVDQHVSRCDVRQR